METRKKQLADACEIAREGILNWATVPAFIRVKWKKKNIRYTGIFCQAKLVVWYTN